MTKKPEKQSNAHEAPLMSQAKAAEMCGMTRAAVHNLVRRNRSRSIEVEDRDLVNLEEVAAFAGGTQIRGGMPGTAITGINNG
jgi:hypothetical protein